ncbi:MAG TPA: isoprenylcysteine carboxylmethyltransferase family protein [Candidatus Saccharimonadales bacterium]|nr:isoprenylcysteine carboxylmethyltransferase family protein [Candidatus Saccharimonadales bacterium]
MRQALPDLGPRGEGWVALQFVIFGAIFGGGLVGAAWSAPYRLPTVAGGVVLMAAGGWLALRGLFDLRESLTVFPRPRDDARLIEQGSYGLVRHPIYGGLVLGGLGWGLATAAPVSLAASLLLAAFFDLKSRREEAWLEERFAGYAAYRSRTRKLIPWVY